MMMMNMEEEGFMTNKVEDDMTIDLPPGFRFHPTDEEIITHYLKEKVMNSSFTSTAIEEADFNKSEPWDLPKKATMGGEKERYYFSQRDRKYPTGMRTNRATESGYWKATGKDKEIYMKGKGSPNCLVGMKKTLVFYTGRAPKGEKTNWVMHEYRLDGKFSFPRNTPKDEWVVSRVFHKSTGIRKIPIIGGGGMMMNTIGDDEDDLLLDCPSSLPPLLDCPSNYYSSRPADCEDQFTAPSANKYGFSIPTSTGMINGHQNTYLLQASNNYNYPTNSLFQSQVPQLQNLAFPFKVEQQFPSSSSNQTMAVSLASQDTGLSTDMNTAEISSVAPMPDFSCLWDF